MYTCRARGSMRARASGSSIETLFEEQQDFVARGDCRLSCLVDQVHRYNAMRIGNVLREEWRHIGVGGAVGKNATDEPISEGLGVGGEPLGTADLVSSKSIGEHGQVFPLEPLAHDSELLGCDLETAWVVERERRLRQHRREHRRLEHHGECEIAGETHADRSHTRAAAFLMREPSERS
jgi:hypothetical protein